MNELAQALIAESYAAPPAHIFEGLTDDLAHRELPNAPHTIYAELWHLAFWQQITLDWIAGKETPYPEKPSDGFPSKPHTESWKESWEQLRHRFLQGAEQAAAAAQDTTRLDYPIRCPSRPGVPTRSMSVRDQLISLATHNAYHLRPHRPSSPAPPGLASSLGRLHLVAASCSVVTPSCPVRFLPFATPSPQAAGTFAICFANTR